MRFMKTQMKIITAFATLSSFGTAMVFPYLWPYANDVLGLSAIVSGILLFSFYGTEAITRIPIGFFGKYLRHSFIVVGGGVSYVLAALFYMAHNLSWQFLFGGQILLGLGISITWVTIPEYVTKTGGSLPVYTFSVGVGYLTGTVVGGTVTDIWGIPKLFTIFFGISIALIIVSLLLQKEVIGKALPTNGDHVKIDSDMRKEPPEIPIGVSQLFISSLSSFREAFTLLKERIEILIAGIVSFIMFMTFAIGSSLIPVYLSGIGVGSFFIGVLLSVRMGTSTFIRLATNKVLEVGDKIEILIAGTFLSGLSILLFTLTQSLYILVGLSLIWGLGGGLYLPIVFSLIADGTDDDERGVAMGLRGTMGTSGSAIGTLTFFYLSGAFSAHSSLKTFGMFVIFFTGVIYALWELKKRD